MTNIKAVAERAGVSPSTVSRVLAGKNYVSEDKRARVMEAVCSMQYSPNVLAKGLKMGRTNTIALFVSSMQNQIYPAVAQGVSDTARKKGYAVILCTTDEDGAVERNYIEKLKNGWVDGFLIASMLPDSHHVYELQESGIPVVLIARSYDERISAVVIDNYRAAYEAISYLISAGHKKIAIAGGWRLLSVYESRYRAYEDALKEYGLTVDPSLCLLDGNVVGGLYDMTLEMLKQGHRPDAVFATTDTRAIIVMRAMRDFGLKVPDDVSVLGFDNIEMSPFVDPPLSTVSQPLYEIGALAAEKVIAMIENGKSTPAVIDIMDTKLIIRKSTRSLK